MDDGTTTSNRLGGLFSLIFICYLIALFFFEIELTNSTTANIIIGAIGAWLFYLLIYLYSDPWSKKVRQKNKTIQNKRFQNKKKGTVQSVEEFTKEILKLKTEKFKLPKKIVEWGIRYPTISDKKVDEFIQWVHKLKSSDPRLKIINSIFKQSKKPELSSVDLSTTFYETTYTRGFLNSDKIDGRVDVFSVVKNSGSFNMSFNSNELDNKDEFQQKIRDIIISLEYDYFDWSDDYFDSMDWESSVSDECYLSESKQLIPYEKYSEIIDTFDQDDPTDGGDTILIELAPELSNASFHINGNKLLFKESEKAKLVTLLMATLKPQVFKKIKERI